MELPSLATGTTFNSRKEAGVSYLFLFLIILSHLHLEAVHIVVEDLGVGPPFNGCVTLGHLLNPFAPHSFILKTEIVTTPTM